MKNLSHYMDWEKKNTNSTNAYPTEDFSDWSQPWL